MIKTHKANWKNKGLQNMQFFYIENMSLRAEIVHKCRRLKMRYGEARSWRWPRPRCLPLQRGSISVVSGIWPPSIIHHRSRVTFAGRRRKSRKHAARSCSSVYIGTLPARPLTCRSGLEGLAKWVNRVWRFRSTSYVITHYNIIINIILPRT